jgi:cephalosporin hydroxylase
MTALRSAAGAAAYVRPALACRSAMTPEFANAMQHGVMSYRYRGIPTLKCPMDLAIYADLLHELRPGTVLEFGSKHGGSALWLADTLSSLGLSGTQLFSFDIEPVTGLDDRRIAFRFCDTHDIERSLPQSFIAALPRPLLVIDDASHNFRQVINVMSFFHRHSRAGDYIVVEDGVISLMGAEDLHGHEGGPFQAIHAFLARHPGTYEIDRRRCDTYGLNVTWNPDGYIRRIG